MFVEFARRVRRGGLYRCLFRSYFLYRGGVRFVASLLSVRFERVIEFSRVVYVEVVLNCLRVERGGCGRGLVGVSASGAEFWFLEVFILIFFIFRERFSSLRSF